jgi:hypothetical protein
MSDATVQIAFRIPGKWSGPQELIERLPEGHRFNEKSLVLPDGAVIDFGAMDADDQFAEIFRSSCRRPPTYEEWATVRKYSVNVILQGPGGSPDAARTMMQAAAAIVRAGGAGVFIDNSTVAHGGQTWLELTDDGGPDALTFGYVAIIGGDHEVRTMGMHVLGRRDVVMKRADADADEFGIIEVMRYLCESEKPIEDGHLLADLDGVRFQAFAEAVSDTPAGSPMHNPFGRLRLLSVKDIAEKN